MTDHKKSFFSGVCAVVAPLITWSILDMPKEAILAVSIPIRTILMSVMILSAIAGLYATIYGLVEKKESCLSG